MRNPESKSAILIGGSDYFSIKAGETNVPKILSQRFLNEPFGVCTRRHNFAFNLVECTMTYLIQGGIPQYLLNYLLDFDLRPLVDPPSEPSVFSLSDLEFGFIVWLIACLISIIAFATEILFYLLRVKLCPMLKDIIGLIVFLIQLRRIRKY